MMNNSKKFLLGLFTLCVVLVGCSDDDDSYSYSSSTDALITKFVLPNNATYATGLSYVYFSIDQYGEYEEGKGLVGQIFNADSLPVGTITNSLLAEITTASASEIMLFTYSDSTMTYSDSVIYSTTDSINFTHPVKVRVTAADKVTRKYYDIKVNVHQANPDSLDWSLLVNDPLSDFTNITDQKAVVSGDEAYWYIESTTGITLYTAPKNDLVSWTKQSCSFPADANVILESLKLFNDDFYCVTNDGALLKSTDGKSFSKYSSEYTFKNLIGSYGSDDDVAQFIAIVYDNNDYYFAYSLNALSWSLGDKLDKDFPVSGYSDAVNYVGGTLTRITIACGRKADGDLINSVWAYDGVNPWAEFPQKVLAARAGASLVTYEHDPRYKDTFWMLIGGEIAGDDYSSTIYYSADKGASWHVTSVLFAFPESYTSRGFSSVYVDSDYFINLIGGRNNSGEINQIWRGRLNNLVFKPVE